MTVARRGRLAQGVAELSPGYFAFVMASGIVSVALEVEGYDLLSAVTFGVGIVGYLTLLVLTCWRVIAFGDRFLADFRDPKRAFGFFTFVAGTNVLGTRAGIEGWYAATAVALAIGGLVWLVLGYVVPWSAVMSREERPVVLAANGTWFVWVVASQSVAIVASTLARVHGVEGLPILAVTAWSVGVVTYAASAVFVSLRLMLYPFGPEEFEPSYWVSMGAIAITILAGAGIVEMDSTPMVDAIRDLVAGLSVVFWCFATWLIPVLFAAGVWRHVLRKVPLVYEPNLWSIVFPLGMYAVASISLGRADQLPAVSTLGQAWLWLAFAAWVVVLAAMVGHLVRPGNSRDAAAAPVEASR
ncbi:tellurite resistance/C4-dicarboxylate transporter family protein [Nocardioides sp. AE5]|uniref:tellurite resistance/C4-dicarboxylate transporter family protein n=1 Tax=Nocardioides sp. AE5 TaxID=2962573 RepID=UPI0028826E60|nr:tellurite resistance/C4-dicarboxylate transporter family protein [Nocardioides sp. AE5]MDT0202055.1 tellurite resistance/C4-dicarboxylate transporter family protein [Nocardioides sp. AE5]